jgi:hypothetical protein
MNMKFGLQRQQSNIKYTTKHFLMLFYCISSYVRTSSDSEME